MITYKGLPSSTKDPLGLRSRLRPSPGGGGRARAERSYEDLIRLPAAGSCPEIPVHLIFAIDSSGSMTGGNDVFGQRFLEGRVAVTKVGKSCSCKKELVSVLHFDTPTGNDLLAVSIKDTEAITKALSVPYDGAGCSSLGASLATATRLAQAHPNHQNTFIVLSDFELFDGPNVPGDFINFPGQPHACVFGGFTGYDDEPRVTVTKVDRTSKPGAVAEATFKALASDRSTLQKTVQTYTKRYSKKEVA